jgi:hypothetical protein
MKQEKIEEAKVPPLATFKYNYVEEEMITYLKQLIGLYTSQDIEFNLKNKTFLVELIQKKLRDHGVKIEDKDYIGLVLDMIRVVNEMTREEAQANGGSEQEKDVFLYIIVSSFYKIGIEAYTMEENSIPGIAASELELEPEY